jgi:lipopolysaccharide/colanic/teichoic acid biosynthesis glycosyltransferase
LIALFITAVSPGPALFKQQRVGYRGRRFMLLKFRTMVVNADTVGHQTYLADLITSDRPMNKLDDSGDPRLLPAGRWIRALGLDELPQLLNVIRGEMSLVGPRPCLPYEFEHYRARHRERCHSSPGLTGLWQVSGKNRLTFEEMIDLDLRYIQHRSLLLDVSIMLHTVPALLTQAWETKTKPRTRGLPLALPRAAMVQQLPESE